MSILGPYIHHVDPVIGTILGVHLWWYGFSYTLGFLNAYLYIQRKQTHLELPLKSTYNLSILLAIGVLLGGRFVEVVFYEWPFYQEHLSLIPAYWLGGMATHGLLFGGLIGIWIFARIQGMSFLKVTDTLAIPGAVIMGVGRLGNFIDGQIVGSITSVPWAIKFPDAEGFRHPVVLYDAIKNLLIVPILMLAERGQPPDGVRTGIFLFLYAFLRIFVDVFREYPTSLLGLATGQVLNIALSIVGLLLIFIPLFKRRNRSKIFVGSLLSSRQDYMTSGLLSRQILFTALLLFSLVMPSDWTQDVPARYGKRHACLNYSAIYPQIDTSPKKH
ncbi:MAG TPA: prolipoprotein diacylglyceryl transferase [Syntrophorhabdaceae bacterium]|nr:prolipoprotein diacylglyceryl transferase [Syntrophorhabdaceae bacterium]